MGELASLGFSTVVQSFGYYPFMETASSHLPLAQMLTLLKPEPAWLISSL